MKPLKKAARKFLANVFVLALTAIGTCATAGPIWVSSGARSLLQIDGSNNQITHTLSVTNARDIALDRTGSAWVVSATDLTKVGPSGQTLFNVQLSSLRLQAPVLAVDPYDSSVWLSDSQTLLHLDAEGRQLGSSPAPLPDVRQAVVALDQSLWVLGNRRLSRTTALGAQQGTWDLTSNGAALVGTFQVDDLAGAVWLFSERTIERRSLGNPTQSLFRADLPGVARDAALASKTGAVWVLTDDNVLGYDAMGTLIQRIDLAGLSIRAPTGITLDHATADLWITHQGGVSRMSSAGVALATLATGSVAQVPASKPFLFFPQLRLVRPSPGLLTNDPRPAFTLEYGGLCLDEPCAAGRLHVETYALSATINEQELGSSFVLNLTNRQATFVPSARLPEGGNSFVAQVRDAFGHLSDSVSATFTIDTIAPGFTSLTPLDGSIQTAARVTVSGNISEPGSVFLENFAELDAAGPNPGGRTFSFDVTLKPGLNVVRLRATDLAGNVASRQLNLNLQQQGIVLNIESPVQGATITVGSVVVSGSFEGPDSVGVTVNGGVAALSAKRFFATARLVPGTNDIRVEATGPGLNPVSKTVTVTGIGIPISVSVSPQAGIAPHPVTFMAFSSGTASVVRMDVDFNGTGTIGASATGNQTIKTTYASPGIYRPRIVVVDSAGQSFTFNEVVVVESVQAIDAKLQALYGSMLAKLRSGDVEAAVKYFTPEAATRYRAVFQSIGNLAAAVDGLGTIANGRVSNTFAEYVLVRQKAGGAQAYIIHFLLCADGVWRIASM